MKSRISVKFLSAIHIGETHYNMYKIVAAGDQGGSAAFAWAHAGYNEYMIDDSWKKESDLAEYLVRYHYEQLKDVT